jgi:hypothetical protein
LNRAVALLRNWKEDGGFDPGQAFKENGAKKKNIIPVFLYLDSVLISFLFAMNKEGEKEEAERVKGERKRERGRERKREREKVGEREKEGEREWHKVKRVKVRVCEKERERESTTERKCVWERVREKEIECERVWDKKVSVWEREKVWQWKWVEERVRE